MRDMVGSYLETLSRATRDAECTSAGGERMTLSAGSLLVSHLCHSAHDSGGKVMFIGNGGSMPTCFRARSSGTAARAIC